MSDAARPDDPFEQMLAAGGDTAALIRDFDWAATPLGPRPSWPQSLKTTVLTMLYSRHPMFLWWGADLIQIYNDAYVPSFGVGKHPGAMGQPGRDCWPEIWEIIGPQIEAVMRDGTPSWHEDALVPIFRNGTIEEVYWTYGYSPVFDDEGRIGGTLVVCTETTARVLATQRERELRGIVDHERARLQQIFAQAPAGICILRGPSLVFEFANDQYSQFVGNRELIGKPMLEALPELAGQGLDTLLQRVIETSQPYVGREVPVSIDRRGSGQPEACFYTFIYSPLREANADVEAVMVLATDVTDEVMSRRRADDLGRLLRESEAQFHLLAESIPQLAWHARPDGFIEWFNRRWYDYTGTTFESMQGWGWTSVHDPQLLGEVVRRWQASVESGEPFEMEFPLRGHDGVLRWHLTQVQPLRDESGTIVRWFGTNTDIDASRRLAEERAALLENEQRARLAAEVASRAKDDFLATASHELRTPLNAILGWARMLQSGQLDQSAYVRAIDSIERNAKAQVRLIEDILDGSRVITGQLQLEIRTLDLTMLVTAALDAVRPAAEAKRIALTLDVQPDAARVVGDPDRLQQVVWNLVNNAIKFTDKDGAVGVELHRAGTDIELRVRDSGEGIAPEFLPHVFERFRQAEAGTTRRHGGLGLGLALVRHLVEAHGGSVRVDSGGIGQGATFTVRLPVQAVFREPAGVPATVRPAEPEAAPTTLASLAGVAVLVVDDESDARDLVATALRTRGAEVTVAADAATALEATAERLFDVLVSDVGMPGTDGYALIASVRTSLGLRGLHLPALALTAYSREEDRRRALDAGFDGHVAKPVDPDELVRLVAGLTVVRPVRPDDEAIESDGLRADVLAKFVRILSDRGVHDALRFLNSRTAHRFTGLYRFDPPTLRNVWLLDADNPEVVRGDDAPLDATYCAIVGASREAFTTEAPGSRVAPSALILSSMRPTLHDIKALVQSYHPLIVLETVEEERVTGLTRQLAFELGIPHMEWSVQRGLFRSGTDPIYETTEPQAMLSKLIDIEMEIIVHLKDLSPHLENIRVARAFRELLMKFGENHSTVVLSGSPVSLPPDIDHMGVHVELKLPDRQTLRALLQETLAAVRKNHKIAVDLSPEDSSALIEALSGLTIDQARQIMAWAMVQDELLSALDIQRILERKARLVHETSVLEYYPLHANRYRIGGFDRLRQWLDRARLGFTTRAKEMNLGAPRGILLVGVQGCGKSLAAKFIAREWQMPLLKLDAGQLYDKYIGESERNFRRAAGVAESMAPVVLWIDEIEKGFGTGRAREEDGGLSSRLFGALLTWLQEKDERVFVVATANDLDNLPPELLRKGRFDEIFFVDLPQQEDRVEIFRIHLQTRNQEPSNFELEQLSAVTEGFSGSEIEQVVVSSLYESLYRDRNLDTETIIEECRKAVPLSRSRAEEIGEIRRKGSRFVPVK